jgi:Ca2+-binding EF-hand superfamily protein
MQAFRPRPRRETFAAILRGERRPRHFHLPAVLLISACLVFACLLRIARAAEITVPSNDSADGDADVRHAVLMLDRSPLHLRLRVSKGGQSLSAARRTYVEKLLRQLDTDADGKLTREEAARSPLLRQPQPSQGKAFLDTLKVAPTVSAADVSKTVTRVVGENVVYRQDDSATESDSLVFALLDDDGNRVLDQKEMAEAAKRLTALDKDGDACVGFNEVQPPPPPPPTEPLLVPAAAAGPPPPRATFSEILRDARDPLLPRRLVRKYDRDRDGALSAAELQWPTARLAKLDRNTDGKLSLTELGNLSAVEVDLDLAIDIEPPDPSQPKLAVAGTSAGPVAGLEHSGLLHVKLDSARVTFSFRDTQPIPEAIRAALLRFNQLDGDGNGYLDMQEVQTDVRLRRGLFDMIDTDRDGRVFGEEVEQYIRLRGEPEAITCRVNVYDTGRGIFQSLDRNNDGRISLRELRTIEQSFQSLKREDAAGLARDDPPRHFHVEFVRGDYRLFGPTDQSVSQLPAFNRGVPAGPIWFQRMDRNNDGDLTWPEFLGHREDFYALDADRDGLIDPSEAEQAGKG